MRFSVNGGGFPANGGARLYNASVRAIGFACVAGSLVATMAVAGVHRPSQAPVAGRDTQGAKVDVSAEARSATVDSAFQAFWSARDRNGAADRIDAILKTGVSFEDALSRVRHGRALRRQCAAGPAVRPHRTVRRPGASLRVRRSRHLRRLAAVSSPRSASWRCRPAAAAGRQSHPSRQPCRRGRRDCRVSGRLGGVDVVVGDADRQPATASSTGSSAPTTSTKIASI